MSMLSMQYAGTLIGREAVIDFPDPDSPTIPTVPPAGTVKLTQSTACRAPSGTRIRVSRASTVSSGSNPVERTLDSPGIYGL